MKRSHIRQFLFVLVLLCSVSSYVFLNHVDRLNTASPSPEQGISGMEDKQETLLPDMAVVKKLIDASKFLSSFVH